MFMNLLKYEIGSSRYNKKDLLIRVYEMRGGKNFALNNMSRNFTEVKMNSKKSFRKTWLLCINLR